MIAHSGVEIGAVFAGKYRVDRVLGQGGMGIVIQAMHLQLNQPVAMKFLLPEVIGNQQVAQRFLREAQAAVRLRSEHVVRVIDVGTLENGAPYIVLEYLEGVDLCSFPRSQLTVEGVVDLVLQACEALAEAHSLGIVHRDIKPANFFIAQDASNAPLLKVLDFGISKAPTVGGQLTAAQTVMGTPAYMSPEQMRSSRDVDHRSDIWSLGIVLYEILQGTRPFGDGEFSAMVLKVVNDPLPRLTVRLPGDLDQIIYRCLEKDPAKRFPNVAELARALAKYAGSETQAAISVQRTRGTIGVKQAGAVIEPAPAQRALPSTISGSVGARTMPRRSGRRWPIVAAMGVLTGGIVVGVIASTGLGRTAAPPPGARPEGGLNTPPPSAATAPISHSVPNPPSALPASTSPIAPPSPASPAATVPDQPSASPTPSHLPPPRSTTAPASAPPGAVVTTPLAPPSSASPGHDAVIPGPRTTAAKPRETARRPTSPAMPSAAPAKTSTSLAEPTLPTAPGASPSAKPEAAPARTASPPAKPHIPPANPPSPPDDDLLGVRK